MSQLAANFDFFPDFGVPLNPEAALHDDFLVEFAGVLGVEARDVLGGGAFTVVQVDEATLRVDVRGAVTPAHLVPGNYLLLPGGGGVGGSVLAVAVDPSAPARLLMTVTLLTDGVDYLLEFAG